MPQERRKRYSPKLERALVEGIEMYNSGHFFECHEVLEEVWLQEEGDDKIFLQGIIKVAAAFHHYRKGTYQGMLDLLQTGMAALDQFRPSYRGVELEAFLKSIAAWIPRARSLLSGVDRGLDDAIPPLVYRP